MSKFSINWGNIRNAAVITGVGSALLTFVGGLGTLVVLTIDSDNGVSNINEAVVNTQTLAPEAGRTVRLVDFDTVQVQQGVLTQTFSFALNRVITSAHYGNDQQFNETADFATYSNPPAITRARAEGCTLARTMKSAMDGYDFGWRASNRESGIRQENLDLANLYLQKHCPGNAP